MNLQDLLDEKPRRVKFSRWVSKAIPNAGDDGKAPEPQGSPAQTYKYLDGRRQTIIESSRARPLIRVADKNLKAMCELEGEIDCSVEELSDDTGKLTITILYDNWLTDWMIHQTREIEDLHILVDPNPAKPNWRTRWGGKITEIHVKQDEYGIHTIQIVALSMREHAKRLLVAANPFFAPEVQIPRMWVMPGPTRTAIATTMFLNLGRLFMPLWSGITNTFNPFGWINPVSLGAIDNFSPLNWPLQVAFVNPIMDQSRWTTVASTWQDWNSSFKDILANSGCTLRAYTYLTTDEDSPNYELAEAVRAIPDLFGEITNTDMSEFNKRINKLVAPKRNCVVFAVEQNDGRTGATGTLADGLISTVAVTLDDLITPLTVNLTKGTIIDPGLTLNGQSIQDATGIDENYFFQKLTGSAPEPPKVIWWDGDYSGANNTDLTYHKSSVKTVMTGGRSPTIVNEAQTFGIRYGLNQIQSTWVGVAAWGGGYGQGGPPVGAGLAEIYQGQLDNTLFAWQRFTDPIRAIHAGDLSWQEHFEKGSGTAYTIASVMTLQSGNSKTRPYKSFKAKVLNGRPWIANQDFFLGDRVGFEKEGIIYVDTVYAIKYKWNRTEPMNVQVAIGEDRNRNDPFAAAFKTIAGVWSLVGMVLGEGTIFG